MRLTRIWLLFVAAYPLLIGSIQLVHFLSWLFGLDINMDITHHLPLYSPIIIAIFVVVSLRERFCVYHRLCLISTLLLNINHLGIGGLTPILANSISSALVLAIIVGLIGSFIHFIYQIQDFIRYVRIKSEKQDANQGTIPTV